MKTRNLILTTIAITIIAACGASKKSKTTVVPPANPPVAETPPMQPITPFLPTPNGIFAPRNEELTAIQTQYAETTMEQLKQGYVLYAEGACINCHKAKNIYTRGVDQWKQIIDNMAPMAKISEAEKDAVYKYVLAIKATQSY